MTSPKEKGHPPQTAFPYINKQNNSSMKSANKMFGAILLQPKLARCIPIAIHSRLSAYGHFTIKACSEGWGIKGIENALNDFGLDGDDIISTAMQSVSGNPEQVFWNAVRQICDGAAI